MWPGLQSSPGDSPGWSEPRAGEMNFPLFSPSGMEGLQNALASARELSCHGVWLESTSMRPLFSNCCPWTIGFGISQELIRKCII